MPALASALSISRTANPEFRAPTWMRSPNSPTDAPAISFRRIATARRGSAHRTSRIAPGKRAFTSSGAPTARSFPPWRVPRQPAPEGAKVAEGEQILEPALPPAPGNPVQVGVQEEVLQNGEVGVQPEPLAHVPDLLVDLSGLRADRPARHPRLSPRGLEGGGEQAHYGGLAGPVRADQPEQLSLRNRQREGVHRDRVTETAGQGLRAGGLEDNSA